mmetsp:Transcript_22945/g.56699  ORF Transcript_22945/g.56699 Transcript_22945/m.56699 type:complete len:231 (+) Transcript_22945:881-1573(+)
MLRSSSRMCWSYARPACAPLLKKHSMNTSGLVSATLKKLLTMYSHTIDSRCGLFGSLMRRWMVRKMPHWKNITMLFGLFLMIREMRLVMTSISSLSCCFHIRTMWKRLLTMRVSHSSASASSMPTYLDLQRTIVTSSPLALRNFRWFACPSSCCGAFGAPSMCCWWWYGSSSSSSSSSLLPARKATFFLLDAFLRHWWTSIFCPPVSFWISSNMSSSMCSARRASWSTSG